MKNWTPQAGDLLAFSGRGLLSATIKFFTHRPWESPKYSHIAIVAPVTNWQLRNINESPRPLHIFPERITAWNDRPLVFESTTLADQPCSITGKRIKGVQAHEPMERLAGYDGDVYLFRMTENWKKNFLDAGGGVRLAGLLLNRIGDQYDGGGAILSGTRIVKRWWAWTKADRSTLFCSEYVAGALNVMRILPTCNASEVHPAGLVRKLTECEIYQGPRLLKRAA